MCIRDSVRILTTDRCYHYQTIEFTKPEKFRFFAKAQTRYTQSGNLEAEILSGQESFKLSPFYQANSWMILPEGTDVIKAGEKVQIMSLHPGEAI